MVKKLNETEMNEYVTKYIKGGNREKLWISLNLGNETIQKWIETGNFKHLKKELQIYHNLEFGCLKENGICHYIFFINNIEAYNRINQLLSIMMDGFKIPIIKCSTRKDNSKWTNNLHPIDGQYNACPLF